MDLTHIYCRVDGWGHLAAIIDCHDREIVGYEFALRGRTREAERALEEACLKRFGTLRPMEQTTVISSENGLVFQSRRFSSGVSVLLSEAGIHHPQHAGAEPDDRAILSKHQALNYQRLVGYRKPQLLVT
jgi:transposase InsO family protein